MRRKTFVIVALASVGYIACGIGATGFIVAKFQGEPYSRCEDYREHLGMATVMPGIFGPLGLLMALPMSGFAEHGWHLDNQCQRPPEPIKLSRDGWVCTSTYRLWHPASRGTLSRFGRVGRHGAYTSIECNQWSAKMTDGSLGGSAVAAEDFSMPRE